MESCHDLCFPKLEQDALIAKHNALAGVHVRERLGSASHLREFLVPVSRKGDMIALACMAKLGSRAEK